MEYTETNYNVDERTDKEVIDSFKKNNNLGELRIGNRSGSY